MFSRYTAFVWDALRLYVVVAATGHSTRPSFVLTRLSVCCVLDYAHVSAVMNNLLIRGGKCSTYAVCTECQIHSDRNKTVPISNFITADIHD
jgi:hypothetical protein